VTGSRSVSLLQFYVPWCGHCQQFKPCYSKLAKILIGIVTIAAIDISSDGPMKRVVGEYGMLGFPTLTTARPRGGRQKLEVRDLNTRDPNKIDNLVSCKWCKIRFGIALAHPHQAVLWVSAAAAAVKGPPRSS